MCVQDRAVAGRAPSASARGLLLRAGLFTVFGPARENPAFAQGVREGQPGSDPRLPPGGTSWPVRGWEAPGAASRPPSAPVQAPPRPVQERAPKSMAMKRAFGQLEAELGVALGAQGEAAAKRACSCAMAQHAAAALQAHGLGAPAPGGHAPVLDEAAYQAFAKYVKCNGEDRDDDQHYSEHYLAHREWWLNYAASMPQGMCVE